MVMVKRALAYGDLIGAVKRATRLPVAAYNVSGEYAMVKAAAAAGYMEERAVVLRHPHLFAPRRRRHRDLLPLQGRSSMVSADGIRRDPDARRAGLKTRSRKHGAAIPLDELDKRLLNLMQGKFPIEPRPYRRVAELAEVSEQEVLRRVQYLLDERIIRQVTPIFDTRALGYSSMLVAAVVGSGESPTRCSGDQCPSGRIADNYLRATTNSTCGSRLPPSPTRRLGWRARCKHLRPRRGRSRCVNCPR